MSATATPSMPASVNLCGTRYRVQESEGLIAFRNEPGVWGCHTRIAFERRCGCWYVTADDTTGAVPVSHVVKAAEIVAAVYGGNHDCPRGEYRP